MESLINDDADDSTALAEAWPRIEQSLLNRVKGDKSSFQGNEAEMLLHTVRRAVRVEVQEGEDGLRYVVLFDAEDCDGGHAAKYFQAKLEKVEQAVRRHTPHRINLARTEVKAVCDQAAVEGEVCPRLMTSLRGTPWPDPGPAARMVEPAHLNLANAAHSGRYLDDEGG